MSTQWIWTKRLTILLVLLTLIFPLAGNDFQIAVGAYEQDDPEPPAPATETEKTFNFWVYVPLAPNQTRSTTSLPVKAGAPALVEITNPNGAYIFNVSWSAYEGATRYVLQQDREPDFANAHIAYAGPGTAATVFVDKVGTYYLRVKAVSDAWESEWSNIQSTQVRIPPPPCPAEGMWSGTTSLGTEITFMVSEAPQCHIQWVEIGYEACNQDIWAEFTKDYPIINGEFFAGGTEARVLGDFTSSTMAEGTFFFKIACPANPEIIDYATGSWMAISP